jgi:dipeptidyl aminopeptidase/acylaminoacyl peptidase
MMDDNVHMQNTAQLIDALQEANKDFEVMFYPRARHGIFGSHYQRLTVEFMKRMLQPSDPKSHEPDSKSKNGI